MKRQKLSVVAAVILLLAGMIIGCDTAANSGSGGTVSESDLYGTWIGTATVDTGITGIEPIPVKVEFKENKYNLVIDGMDLPEGIWVLGVNNTITIIVSSEDGSGPAKLSYELNNNKLEIRGEAFGDGIIIRFDLTRK